MLVFLTGGTVWLGAGSSLNRSPTRDMPPQPVSKSTKKTASRFLPLPPHEGLRYTQLLHIATPTVFNDATDFNPPPTL